MSKIYTHLTMMAQKFGAAFDIPQWDTLDFDDLFRELMAIPHNDDADEVVRMLYSYAGAYGGYSTLGELYSLKKETITPEEQKQYDEFRARTMELRGHIHAKLKQLEEKKKKG